MRAPTRERDPRDRRVYSANDRMKAQWNTVVAWSMMAAAGFHAAMFVFLPKWERSEPPPDRPTQFIQLEGISFLEYEEPSTGGLVATPAASLDGLVSSEEDTLRNETSFEVRLALSDAERAELSAQLRDRLLRRASHIPTITDVEPEAEQEEASQSDETSPNIGAGASTADFQSLRGLSRLDLERLSSVRPEVALVASSEWVLLRNPAEVERFMSRRERMRRPTSAPEATVSVAVWINDSGHVEWAEIVGSSGRAELDEMALDLFSDVVTFRPARLEGVPMPTSAIFFLSFPW